jgi:hypothetical protein
MLWAGATARACQIPVFRYALERWEAAPYEVVIFHRGALAGEHKAAADAIAAASSDAKGHANLQVRRVDLDKPLDKPTESLWKEQKNATTPWMVVLYPDSQPDTIPVHAGPLSAESADRVANSPARRQIAQRILKGESAVWVLIEGGAREADDAAEKMLAAELKKLEKSLQLPDLNAPEGPRLWSNLPVKLAFSTIRVSRNDPAEAVFVQQFVNSDKDAAAAKGPMVFAVFGQGRAIGPLTGQDLSPKVVGQAAEFLVGECSCQVKEQNPGFDLLMSAPWASILSDVDGPVVAPSGIKPPATAPTTRPAARDPTP